MHQSEQSSIPSLIKRDASPALKYRGNSQFFGLIDPKEGSAIALKFVTLTGAQKALAYHDIVSPMDFDGAATITLITPRIVVTIKGQNLEKLFDHIIQHQVLWIKEPQGSFAEINDKEVQIKSLSFDLVQ